MSPARRLLRPSLALSAALLAAGCSTLDQGASYLGSGVSYVTSWAPSFLGPYRPDVHQGNIITREMVEQLRVGMSREQVRFMLGTPLLMSEFHKDRWDYAYYLNRKNGETQNRRLTLFFQDNKLARWSADVMPDETMADALILGPDLKRKPRPAATEPREAPTSADIQTPAPTR